MTDLTKQEVARVYNYLLNNHRGEAHAGGRDEIREALGIGARRFREITHMINTSPDYPFIVSVSGKIYIVDSGEESIRHIMATIRSGVSLLKKARAMAAKVDRQSQLAIGEFFELERIGNEDILGETRTHKISPI